MIELELVLRILAGVRDDALRIVASPSDNQKTAFDFGRANGIIQAVTWIEELLDEQMKAQKEREREE